MKAISYDADLLLWHEAMLKQQIKYSDTPPGLSTPEDIRMAQEKLSRLKTEYQLAQMPVLKSEYAESNEPFASRERELGELHSLFAMEQGPIVLCGIGGIGKTSIAKAYAHRYQAEYRHILFLTCSGSMLRLIASDEVLPVSTMSYQRDKYGNLYAYFSEKLKAVAGIMSKEKTLLILDDWNSRKGPGQTEVLSLPCDILITSRLSPTLWPECRSMTINAMGDLEWRAVYRLYGGELSEKELTRIEEYRHAVEGHTLRTVLYLRHSSEDASSASDTDILSRFPLKRAEIQMLMELSVMPVSGVSRQMFLRISTQTEAVLRQLEQYLLVRNEEKSDGTYLSVHPVISEEIIRNYRPTAEKCRGLLRGTAEAVNTVWIQPESENKKWEGVVFSLMDHFRSMPGWLCRQYDALITWMLLQEYYAEAISAMKKLMKHVINYYGEGSAMTGEIALRMAAAYYNAREYGSADLWYEKSYTILREAKDRDLYQTAIFALACSKLSRAFRHRSDYLTAMQRIDEALETNTHIREQSRILTAGGKSSPLPYDLCLRHAYFLIDKGKILLRTGKPAQAEKIYLEAHSVLQEDSRSLYLGTNTFARTEFDKFELELLTAKGEFNRAEKKAEEMLDYALKWRDEGHVYVLEIREQLADILRQNGKQNEALREYSDLLRFLRRERPFWTEKIREVEQKVRMI